MGLHQDRLIGHVHVAHNWEYADATARLAATGFVAGDLKKLALQLDNSSYWVLTATTPTWANVGGGGTGVTVSGTPTSGQIAEWISATAVQGKAVTGSGNVVLATSPTLITPALGTPSAIVLTNATGTPAAAIGLANATGLPISTGVSGLGTGVATFLGTPSSANLLSAVTGAVGTGGLVFGTSPVFTTDITLPNGASPTTSSVAKTAFATAAWASGRGAIQIHDGTANTFVVAALASSTPADGKVPTWHTGGTITWDTPSTGGTPGGSTTQFQYNNAGAFAGTSNLIYDSANARVGVATAAPKESLHTSGLAVGGAVNLSGAAYMALGYAGGVGQIYVGNWGTAYTPLTINALHIDLCPDGTERARVSNAGNILIGTTADTGLTGAGGLSVGSTTEATTATAASAIFAGGVGIAKKLFVTGNAAIAGVLSETNSTEATSTTAASAIFTGGVGVAKKLFVGGNTTIGNETSPEGLTPVLQLGANANQITQVLYNFGATPGAGSYYRTGRGTQASFSAIQSGDQIGTLQFAGAVSAASLGTPAYCSIIATENYSGTNQGCYWQFSTIATGANALTERARFSGAGNLLVGTTSDTGLTGVGGLKIGSTTDATSSTAAAEVNAGGLAVAKKIITGDSIQTGTPSGGTAGAWKFGIRVAATVVLDTTQYIQLDVGGTLYKLAIAA